MEIDKKIDFKDCYLGIFWVYKGNVIAKRLPLDSMSTDSLGCKDTPFQHVDEWEVKQIYLPDYPLLAGTDYYDVPRGRIIFKAHNERIVIYADKACFSVETKMQIIEAFGLNNARDNKLVVFKRDPHYQSAPKNR
jgi:hypothetical protein